MQRPESCVVDEPSASPPAMMMTDVEDPPRPATSSSQQAKTPQQVHFDTAVDSECYTPSIYAVNTPGIESAQTPAFTANAMIDVGAGGLNWMMSYAHDIREDSKHRERRRLNRLKMPIDVEETDLDREDELVVPWAENKLLERHNMQRSNSARSQVSVADETRKLVDAHTSQRPSALDATWHTGDGTSTAGQSNKSGKVHTPGSSKPYTPDGNAMTDFDLEEVSFKRSTPEGTAPFSRQAADEVSAKVSWYVDHKYFTYGVSLIVVLNAIFIFFDEEHKANLRLAHKKTDQYSVTLQVFDIIFAILFFVEVGLRMAGWRLSFFCQPHCLFDFSLVTLDVGFRLASEVAGSSMTWFRVLRLGRLLWLMHVLPSLWVIIIGVLSAMRTLVWAGVLLLMVIYVFGIVVCRLIGKNTEGMSPEDLAFVDELFGTIPKSMFTLLTMMTMEGWAEVARFVFKMYSSWWWIFFFLFFSATTWGLMNLVAAVIIEATVGKALHHLENYVKVTREERTRAIKKICNCFFLVGYDDEGNLSREKFKNFIRLDEDDLWATSEIGPKTSDISDLSPLEHGFSSKIIRNISSPEERRRKSKLREKKKKEDFVDNLHSVGIDVRQADTLFDLLDFDKSGSLNIYEFVEGVLEARGKGRAMDVLRVKYDLKRYNEGGVKANPKANEGGIKNAWRKEMKDGVHKSLNSFASDAKKLSGAFERLTRDCPP